MKWKSQHHANDQVTEWTKFTTCHQMLAGFHTLWWKSFCVLITFSWCNIYATLSRSTRVGSRYLVLSSATERPPVIRESCIHWPSWIKAAECWQSWWLHCYMYYCVLKRLSTWQFRLKSENDSYQPLVHVYSRKRRPDNDNAMLMDMKLK